MKIKLEFNAKDVGYLVHTGSNSFVSRQQERFHVYSGIKLEDIVKYEEDYPKKSSLWFCDTYLEAKIYQSYYKNMYPNTSILGDEFSEAGEWCIWVPAPMSIFNTAEI